MKFLSKIWYQSYQQLLITSKKLLSVVRALDVEIEKIVKAAQNLDRETLFIFQSDNGGRSLSQARFYYFTHHRLQILTKMIFFSSKGIQKMIMSDSMPRHACLSVILIHKKMFDSYAGAWSLCRPSFFAMLKLMVFTETIRYLYPPA